MKKTALKIISLTLTLTMVFTGVMPSSLCLAGETQEVIATENGFEPAWEESSEEVSMSEEALADEVLSDDENIPSEDELTEDIQEPVLGDSASYAVTGGKIYFDTATGTVTGSDAAVTEVIIPEAISGVTVKAIGNNAFGSRNSLKKVVMPDTVETIGDNAFQNCSELESVVLSANLKKVGAYAFRFDESLESVTMNGEMFDPFDENNGVEVGYLAFTDCFFLRLDFSDSYKKGVYYKQLHSKATRKLLKGKQNHLSDVIVIAKSQLGYHEGDSYDQMDGNAYGFDDYSEYTCWWGEPGEMWCGEFVGWCIAMASVPQEIFERKYRSPKVVEWKDTVYAGGDYTLKQGDVLHFDYDGGNHVCLVYGTRTDGDTVKLTTLDGNHSNDVSWCSYTIDKKTGQVKDDWAGKNAYIAKIYAPDATKTVTDSLTYYKVTFDVNGGDPLKEEGEEANWFCEPDEKELTYGASYGIMPLPTRDGYEFVGWYTRQNEGEEGDKKITSYRIFKEHSDQTLYARWAKPETGSDPGAYSGSGKTYNSVKDVVKDGLTWKIDEDTGTITQFPAAWQGGEVPSVLDGITVKAIADNACSGNDNITELIIPDGITELGDHAFGRCGNLTNAVIGSGVKRLGSQCFMYCTELEDIEFKGDIDEIRKGTYVFYRTPWFNGDLSDEYKHGPWYLKLLELQNGTNTVDDPELTGDLLEDAIKIGQSQLDYHEGDDRSELTGLNPKGNGEYAEPVFFSGSPDYLWFKNVPQKSYGGWCGQYCSWVLRMAGFPDSASGMLSNDDEDEYKWEDLTIAGKAGGHELQRGDVLHMRIGHYCIVCEVVEKDGWVYIKTLNGNHGNAVCWDTYRLDPVSGRQKKDGTKSNYDVTDIYAYRPDKLKGSGNYELKFDPNGGTVQVSSKTVYDDGFYGLLPEPVRTGYIFEGWYTETEGGKKITPYRMVRDSNTDVTVYARWRSNSTSVTGIEMGSDDAVVKVGENITLTASAVPATATDRSVTWRSTDESIATVSDKGVVKGITPGEVSIIAKTADGGYYGRTLVEVSDGSEKIALSDDKGYIKFIRETGTITGSEIYEDDVCIPAYIGEDAVREIGRQAFYDQDALSMITIPTTVQRIGVSAFAYTNLTSVTIPASVREIRGYAFSGLESLNTLTIENGTKYIYSGAFSKCTGLTEVYIPNSVRYIYSKAFDGCENLKKVTFQGSRTNLKHLDESAFPDGCELVFGTEDYEGEDDYEPKSDDTGTSYEVGTKESDYEIDDEGYIKKSAYNITNAQIPSAIGGKTVKGVRKYAFGTRSKLKALSIPDTVTDIEEYAFWHCMNLETLYIPDSVENLGKYAFGIQNGYTGKLSKVTIGKGIKTIGSNVFWHQNALEEIVIRAKKADVTIDENAFPAGVKVTFADEGTEEDPENTDPENTEPGNEDPENKDQDKNKPGKDDQDKDNNDNEQKIKKVTPVYDTDIFGSSQDNIAPVCSEGKTNKLKLDFSNVSKSEVAPDELKMTLVQGSKLVTASKLKDKDSVKAGGGIKVKVNKKTLIGTITCKGSGTASFIMEDGITYTVNFVVEKPKPDNRYKNLPTEKEKSITLGVKDLFNTSIDGGSLTVIKQKHSQALVSDNTLTINPEEKDSIKLEYKYLNKKYKMTIKIK